jgi:hypothetical protein
LLALRFVFLLLTCFDVVLIFFIFVVEANLAFLDVEFSYGKWSASDVKEVNEALVGVVSRLCKSLLQL